MTPQQLRVHRAVLGAHKALLDEEAARNKVSILAEQFETIREDIDRFQAECPGVVPPLDARQVVVNRMSNATTVGIASLRSYLARATAILDSLVARPEPVQTNHGFLSHAASDEALANYLRIALEAGARGSTYFQASHRGQIPPGDSWCGPIFEHLRRADRFLILLTPASVGRLWVAFETGVAWMPKEYPRVLLCAGGLEPKDVPTPFAELQLLFLDARRGRDAVLETFKRLGSQPPADMEAFLADALALAEACTVDGLADGMKERGYEGVRVGDRFLAWAGPVDDLQDQPGVRPSTPEETDMVAALRAQGLEVAYGHLDRLGSRESRQVFSISSKGWKRPILYADGRQVLMVRKVG